MKGTLRLFLTLCIAMLSMTLVQAQERTYSGTVRSSEDGQVIIGANVELVGTTRGVNTGIDGKYTINASAGQQLAFSYLGMKPQTITLGNTPVIDITLDPDTESIETVVVVAFGTTKKRDLTGAVSSIDSKIISQQSNSTLTRALEGAIPGLQVSSVDGQPGVDMGIRIRGIGTADQNNANALIVIDGVPATNDNALAMLNPKDVESITILKDAASTALWGSRGANGVVMVTTKRGQQGKARISFDARWGQNRIGSNQADLIKDPKDIYEWAWQSIYNTYRYGDFTSGDMYSTNASTPNTDHATAALYASQHLFDFNGSTTALARNSLGNHMLYYVPGAVYTPSGTSSTMTGAYLVNTDGKLNPNAQLLFYDDWEDIFIKKKLRQEYTLTISGASEKTDYYISAGYLEDPSYIKGSTFNRYNFRTNLNSQVRDWLKVGYNMAYSRRATQSPATRYGRNPGGVAQNIFTYVRGQSALAPMWERDQNGDFVLDGNGNRIVVTQAGQTYSPLGEATAKASNNNLLYQVENDKDETIYNDLNMRAYAEAKFLNDFTVQVNLSYDNVWSMRNRYANKEYGQELANRGAFGRVAQEYNNLNSQQTINWNRSFEKHNVDVLAGHEFNWKRDHQLRYRSAYSLIPNFNTYANFIALGTGGTYSDSGGSEDQEALEGYFGRVNYNYDNKYYLTASIRGDGSSKFKHMSQRWGVFWSVGGAWRLTGEEWMQNATWLNDLKIRADYGEIGNQNGINRYSGYTTWTYSTTAWNNYGNSLPSAWSISQGNYVNQNLTWETKRTVDVGLDFRLFDRFYGTFDWYQTKTVDMIWGEPTPISLGQSSITTNSASMRTRGVEVELGVDIISNPDILWSVNVNGARYRSELTSVPESTKSEALGGNWTAGVDAWTMAGSTGTSEIAYLRGVGKPYYNMYLFKYAGVDQNTGLPMYYHRVTSEDHDAGRWNNLTVGSDVATTIIDYADRYEMGDATPDFAGGFGTTFRWKNLDFSAQFAYQIGGLFFSNEYALNFYNNAGIGTIKSKDLVGNTWTPDNTSAKFPMQMISNPTGNDFTTGVSLGSWMYTDLSLFKASYLSVKNITLGYTLPQQWMDKVGIESVRVYATMDNPWFFSKQKGVDPRMSIVGGFDVGTYTYQYMRTFSLGLNINF